MGWNLAIRGSSERGVREDRPPSPTSCGIQAALSRLQAVAVTRRMADRYPECTCGEHTLLNNIADCERTVMQCTPACSKYPGRVAERAELVSAWVYEARLQLVNGF